MLNNSSAPFLIGEEVVCVDDNFMNVQPGEIVPKKARKYIVRSAKYFPGRGWGLTFEEIINEIKLYSCGMSEPHFNSKKFRRLSQYPALSKSEMKELTDNVMKDIAEVDVIGKPVKEEV